VQGDKELVGTLRGFDEFVNMVMDDVTQYETGPGGLRKETKLVRSRVRLRVCVCVGWGVLELA